MASFDVGVGRILVERRLLAPEHLDEFLAAQGRASPPDSLPILLAERGRLTPAQIADALATHVGALREYDPRAADRARAWRVAALVLDRGCAPLETVLAALRDQERRAPTEWTPLAALLLARGTLSPALADELERSLGPAPTEESPGVSRAANAPTVEAHPPGAAAPTISDASGTTGAGGSAPTLMDGAAAPAKTLVPPPARRLGQYEWTEILGRGGMGVVYKAYHPGLKCFYAVKALQAEDDASADAVRRFHKEAEALAKLRHPGIVGVHDIWSEGGRTYLAMEYVEGKTLDTVIARAGAPAAGGGLPEREALRIAAEVAEAIAYAHDLGVLHRDLKPANVIVDPRGRVKVMDFGLAKIVDAGQARVTRTGVLVGTPAYMSPEQVDEGMHAVDAQSDVYQIGAILYESLSGTPPYVGDGTMDTLMRVAARDPEPLRTRRPALGRDAETVCLKAMARERPARYASARELAEDCRRVVEGEPIRARRERPWAKLWRWARRRKALSALAAAAVLALALAGGFAWRVQAAEREKAELEAQVLRTLRMVARTNLEATLMVRRTGGSLREARERFLGPLEEAAREAVAKLPTLAEPHYHLGRMYRALLAFDAARTEQEAALAKDPGDTRARYEQALLNAHFLGRRAQGLRDQWLHAEGRRLASGGRLEAGSGPEAKLRPRPPDDELIQADAEASALRDRVVADLEALERNVAAAPEAISPARLSCARGLFRLHLGRAAEREEAQRLLEAAVGQERELEEAYEGLARLHDGAGRLDAAIEALDRGIAVDRGYAPFWLERGQAWADRGQAAGQRGADADADYARAEADLTQAVELNPDAAETWLRRGKLRTTRGIGHEAWGRDPVPTYEQALADHDRALELTPDLAAALLARGNTHCDLGLYLYMVGRDPTVPWTRSAEDYTRSLELDPGVAETWMDRGNLHMNRANRAQSRGEDSTAEYVAGEADFGRALELDPASSDAWMWRGMLRNNWGIWLDLRGQDPTSKYEAALADFTRALEHAPKAPRSWLWRGNAHANFGLFDQTHGRDPSPRYAQAIADLDRAIELHPALADARIMRARTHSHWAVVLEISGRDPQPLYERALADLDRLLARPARFAEAWVARGMVRVNLGIYRYSRGADVETLWRGAEEDYGKALECNPKLIEAHVRRARVRANLAVLDQGRGRDPAPCYARAVADYEAAAALNPESADLWMGVGMAQGNWGIHVAAGGGDATAQFTAAIAALEKSVRINPGNAMASLQHGTMQANWALVLERRGADPEPQRAGAQVAFQRALDLNPNSAEAWENLGRLEQARAERAYSRGEDFARPGEAALAHYTRALKENPNHVDAYGRRGLIHRLFRRWEEAVADFEKVRALNPRAFRAYEQALADTRLRAERHGRIDEWATLFRTGAEKMARGEWPEARTAYEAALAGYDRSAAECPAETRAKLDESARALRLDARYNLACLLAQASAGRDRPGAVPSTPAAEDAARSRDAAFAHLDAALDLGWQDVNHLEADGDLEPLRTDPRWAARIARLRGDVR